MKLIMRTEFDNIRLNDNHAYDTDINGDKQVVKIYHQDKLIAKKVTHKKSIRYFAVKEYKKYLTDD